MSFTDTADRRLERKVQSASVVSVDISQRIILSVGHFTIITVKDSVLLFDQITLLETAVGVVDYVSVVTVIDDRCDISRIDLSLSVRVTSDGTLFKSKVTPSTVTYRSVGDGSATGFEIG